MNKINSLFILFFLLSISLVVKTQDVAGVIDMDATTNYFSIAEDLYKGKSFYEAIFFYEEVLKSTHQNDVNVMYKLSECYRISRNYKKAEENYKKVQAKDIENKYPLTLYYIASMQQSQEKYLDAQDTYNRFIQKYMVTSDGYVEKSRKAIEACKKATEIKSKPTEFVTDTISIPGNTSPSIYGSVLYDNTLWLTSSVKVFKERKVNMKEIRGRYDYYFVDRLYTAERDKRGKYSNGKVVENLFYTMTSNYLPPTFSSDKKTLYVSVCEKKSGNCFINSSKNFTLGGEINLEEMDEPINIYKSSSRDPFVTKINGREIIFFSSNRTGAGGKGGFDLYYGIIDSEGNPTEVHNLGDKINTSGDEISPFYDTKNKVLYFASDGQPGLGNFDIFKISGDPTAVWTTTATNLGYPINTGNDEYYFYQSPIEVPYTAFVSSNRYSQGKCCDDVLEIKRKARMFNLSITAFDAILKKPLTGFNVDIYEYKDDYVPVIDTNSKGFNVIKIANREDRYNYIKIYKGKLDTTYVNLPPLKKDTAIKVYLAKSTILMEGFVMDSKTKIGVKGGMMKFINKETNLVLDSVNSRDSGFYRVRVPMNKKIIVNINAQNYMLYNKDITYTPQESAKEPLKRNFTLQGLEVGAKVILNNITFEFKKSTLRNESFPELQRAAKFMNDYPQLRFEISGHTDNVGNLVFNQTLSEERAEAVMNYLIEQGISVDRLEAKGYSYKQPVASNGNEYGRALNRRVEFKIIK